MYFSIWESISETN